MTSRSLLPFAAAVLLCLRPAASASTLAADPAREPSPAQPQTQTRSQMETHPSPIFSLGTISIAPTSQCFPGPSINAGATSKSKPSRAHRPVRRSRRIAEPVPLRTYSRA